MLVAVLESPSAPSGAASRWINETSKLHFRGGALFLIGLVDSSTIRSVYMCGHNVRSWSHHPRWLCLQWFGGLFRCCLAYRRWADVWCWRRNAFFPSHLICAAHFCLNTSLLFVLKQPHTVVAKKPVFTAEITFFSLTIVAETSACLNVAPLQMSIFKYLDAFYSIFPDFS